MDNNYMERNPYYASPGRRVPYVTIFLIAVNVVIYLIMEVTGSTQDTDCLYNWGAMYLPAVLEQGEIYRVFAHMFLHAGPDHLINNMFMLGAMGYQVEEEYGRMKYLITYFVCGLGATVASALYDTLMGEYAVGVGASGAIFGIFGVTLVMIFKNRRQTGQVSAPRLMILFLVMVFGNMQEGVDWMAHFGGALTGVLIGLVCYKPKSQSFI